MADFPENELCNQYGMDTISVGAAMMHSGFGLSHAMANTIGGFYHNSAHKWLIARTLEKVCEFNKSLPKKYS